MSVIGNDGRSYSTQEAADKANARMLSQQQQIAGTKTPAQAQAEKDAATAKALQSSTTINRYAAETPSQVQAQQNINQKYNLQPGTGLSGPGGLAPEPARTQVIPSTGPTPQNPMKPVSAQGANTPLPSTPAPTTYQNNFKTTVKAPQVTMDQTSQTVGKIGYNEYGGLGMSLDDYMSLSPEEQIQAQAQAVQAQGQQQSQIVDKTYDAERNQLAQKQEEIQRQLEKTKAEEDAANAAAVEKFKSEQAARTAEAQRQVERSAQQRQEQADLSLSFQGFGRSTKAADLRDNIRQDTQAQIADINRQSENAVNEYQAGLLDKTNAKIEKLQARVDQYGSAKDQVELERVKAQGDLQMSLLKANPLNPQNMMETAEKLTKTRLEQQKLDLEEKKALQDKVAGNFKYMVENFGGAFVQNLSPEEKANYAYALGVPASVLDKVNKSLAEQKDDWDKLKYFDSQDFELKKMSASQRFDLQKIAQQQGFDWDKMQASQDFDVRKMILGKQLDKQEKASKFDGLGYSKNASAVSGGGYSFDQPVPTLDGKNLAVEYNPNLAGAFPNGYKFSTAGGNKLAGQCLYFAEQLTTLGGKNWAVGNSIQEKKQSLAKYRNQGLAFYPGEDEPQVGNTILTNDSKTYGHGAVISGKTPDGKLILTESNFKGPLTVSNTRTIDPNDPRIFGFLKTEPKAQYKVAQNIGRALEGGQSASKGNIGRGIYDMVSGGVGALANVGGMLPRGQQSQNQMPSQEQLSPFRQAVRSGKQTLTSEQELSFAQENPEGFQQYMQDKMIGKQGGGAGEKLPATQITMLEDAKFLPDVLNQLEGTIKNPNVTFDPFWGSVNKVNPLSAYNDTQKVADAQLRTAAQLVGKFMEGGVLRAEDEAKYQAMLPNSTDSRDVALQKLQQIRQMLQNKMQGYVSGFGNQGYNVSGYMQNSAQPVQPTQQMGDPLGLGFSGGSTGGNDPLGLGL